MSPTTGHENDLGGMLPVFLQLLENQRDNSPLKLRIQPPRPSVRVRPSSRPQNPPVAAKGIDKEIEDGSIQKRSGPVPGPHRL